MKKGSLIKLTHVVVIVKKPILTQILWANKLACLSIAPIFLYFRIRLGAYLKGAPLV